MPAYYHSSLREFFDKDPPTILWRLTQANGAAQFPLTPQAIDAWDLQLPFLTSGLSQLLASLPEASDWGILLEYPIPMVGKRVDAVVLAHNVIIVIETKTGASPNSAARQVDDYALNLACFHEYSEHKKIVPVVVSDSHVALNSTRTVFDNLIEPCRVTSTSDLGSTLRGICDQYVDKGETPIKLEDWNRGRFRPIPPIIDAAVALYSGMDVFEIGHACAAREDLERTTNTLVEIVLESQRSRRKAICFTTGVPGAGKTLVGLNTVHSPEIKNFSSFLSGNGPLVRVIQEALIRDVVQRNRAANQPVTRGQAELEVRTFVHNVHRFADQYYGEGRPEPAQNVIVFDEAQRAWDAEQNQRAERPHVSEPQMMLEVMDRRSDWAMIIGLIGGGQEINRGEAGLAEWGRALKHFPEWRVYASPIVLRPESPAGYRLFEDRSSAANVIEVNSLHLKVSTRSIRAQRISEWVDAVLSGNADIALRTATALGSKPVVTRNLVTAREWLKSNQRGRTRAGLVASASAARLRMDGLEPSFDFHQRFEWEHWFLDTDNCDDPSCTHRYCNDVRACSKLEVAATQFEIQGLELDWVGLCWSEDLTWDGTKWICRKFNNKKWKPINLTDTRRLSYLVNAYRVLMTRARQGMVLYIPSPPNDDASRLRGDLDRTSQFLISCGAEMLVS